MEKIAQGAEAVLYRDHNAVIKERVSKSYRLPQLDESLRQFRTRREAKILGKLEEMNFPAPHLKAFSDKRMSIVMDFVPGQKLKDVLDNEDVALRAREMGQMVAQLHQKQIIHGDLTTSNMIIHQATKKLNLLDFGLSFFSEKVEDQAVDLALLDRALESTHYRHYPSIFDEVLAGYQENNPQGKDVVDRLQQVRARGRNKNKD